jgi:hypothetical protein
MAKIFYSPSIRGFYRNDVSVPVPPDAIEIEESNYLSLLEGQEQGLNIVPGLDGVPVLADPPPATPEQILAAERAQMNPFAAAFWQAMKQVPATGFAHLLDRVEQTVAAARAVDPYAGIVLWADKVTQVVRLHPDMDAFRVQFGASEAELDDLFRLALQIERGA